MKQRKNIEDAIQKQLVLWLKQRQIEFYFNKNEGKKSIVEAVNDKKMGLTAGRPDLDLYVIRTPELQPLTYILHLELKKKDGKLNAAQKIWHANFKQTLNREAKVAYGLDEAKFIITQWIMRF